MNRIILAIFFAIIPAAASAANLPLNTIKLPPGFKIEMYAENLPGARSMTFGDKGTLFVGTRTVGDVYAAVDTDGDQKADKFYTIATNLTAPNGVAFRKGSLYLAEIFRITRYDDIENHLVDPPKPVLVNQQLPREGHHGWKFIKFGPDDKLYVPVGAPCNVCESDDKRFASILRMDPDGHGLELFAAGIRNTVGFDWHPETKELWFTDNGRDNLGDNQPPDELNHAPNAKMHFGFPYCHGGTIRDPEFGKYPCQKFTPPAQRLGPHVASLGMRFYTGKMFPEEYQKQIFIAEHGSWNRSTKLGYRVMLVKLEGDKVASYEPFAEGWLQGEKAWGRPVDVEVAPDGALLVSDDQAGVIYRISYSAK